MAEQLATESAVASDVDAILQRLMPPGKAPGDLNRSSDSDDSPPAAKRDKTTVGLLSSFEDTTGDVSEFLIPNPSPICKVVREEQSKSRKDADQFGSGKFHSATAARRAIPLGSPTARTRKPANRDQPQSASSDATSAGGEGDVSPSAAAAEGLLMSELVGRLLATLETSPTGYVDLEVIMQDVGLAERWRLLHVVSVLEGLGVVGMPLSNVVKWLGEESPLICGELQQIDALHADVDKLAEREHDIDTHIRWLKQSFLNVCENVENDRLAYTSHDDILGLFPDRFNVAVRMPTSAAIDTNVVSDSGLDASQNGKHLVYELAVRCKSAMPKAYVLSMDGHAAYSVDD